MNWFRMALSLLVVAGGGAALFFLGGGAASPIRISDARATVHDMNGAKALAIALTITNEGGPDRMLSAASPDAKLATLHGVTDASGAPVPAMGSASLSLDGAHAMLMGVGDEWVDGHLIPLSLTFQNAGEVSTKATLSAAGGGMNMSGQGMQHSMNFSAGMTVDASMAPSIAIVAAPVDNGWRIRVETTRFAFKAAAMDGPHVAGEGHGHLYIGGLKIMRMTTPEVTIGALPSGRHEVRVTLNTNNHMAYHTTDGPVSAATFVTVPSDDWPVLHEE